MVKTDAILKKINDNFPMIKIKKGFNMELNLKDGKIIKFSSVQDLVANEKKMVKKGIKLPFCLDLSNKLMSYEVLTELEQNMEDMVKKIWD